jgi:hypothetical protein
MVGQGLWNELILFDFLPYKTLLLLEEAEINERAINWRLNEREISPYFILFKFYKLVVNC